MCNILGIFFSLDQLDPENLHMCSMDVANSQAYLDIAFHISLSQHSQNIRRQKLRRFLREGSAWEISTAQIISSISRKKFKKKRVGTKTANAAERLINAPHVLGPEEATDFRALAARANYLALDRPDIAYTTKELCRCFAAPTKPAVDLLRRLVRYLPGKPRLVWLFNHQPSCTTLTSSLDTDFAGCLETRRSTSGGVARRGQHLIKHWSSTQATVTLSSAEAELNGIRKGASISLGLQSVAKGPCNGLGPCITIRCHSGNWGMPAPGPGENSPLINS